jgi:hypothetical protein
MTQETVQAAPTEETTAPTDSPVTEVTPIESPPEQAPEETDAQPEPPSFEDWKKENLDSEEFPHREAYQAYVENLREEGWKAAEDFLGPRFQQLSQLEAQNKAALEEFHSEIGSVRGRIEKNIADGQTTEEAVVNAFASNKRVLDAMTAVGETAKKMSYEQGALAGRWTEGLATTQHLYGELFKAAGKPSLMASFTPRIQKAQSGEELQQILKDFTSELDKAYAAKYLPLGKKGGIEEANVKNRATQKPTQAAGTPAGQPFDYQKRLDRLALGRDSDGREATAEDKAWLAAQE